MSLMSSSLVCVCVCIWWHDLKTSAGSFGSKKEKNPQKGGQTSSTTTKSGSKGSDTSWISGAGWLLCVYNLVLVLGLGTGATQGRNSNLWILKGPSLCRLNFEWGPINVYYLNLESSQGPVTETQADQCLLGDNKLFLNFAEQAFQLASVLSTLWLTHVPVWTSPDE